MGGTVEYATFEILSIQAGLAQLRSNTTAYSREAGLRKDRRNAAGMLVMMRATAGDFDAQVSAVEERVAALESRIVRYFPLDN